MDEQQQSYLRKSNIPFTMVANAIIFDNRISSKAKFYYVYLSSKPDGWKFHTNCIIKEIKEGRDAFYSGLKELIQFGYLERTQINEGGKFKHTDFLLKIPPYTENTHTEVAYTENTDYNNKYINKKDKSNNYNINTASGFSQSENSLVNDSFTTQNPTVKESLTVQNPKKEIEITKKDDIESFVRNFKATKFEVDGVIQFQSIFSENEIELITGYLLKRKEKHKSRAKSSQQAIKAILNKILEIKGVHALEVVFEQNDGCYVNCGTAGDPTTPWIRLELEYFTKLIKKPTFNNQYAKTKPDYLEVQKRYAATGELQLSTTYRKRRD